MKAIVIGATGATGKDLVNVLLQDADYTSVVVFVRHPTGIHHSKLLEIITDFDKLQSVSNQINGDALFSCLGTTLKAAGSKEKQWHIDYEIPLEFATIAKANGVSVLVLLSAYGSSATSKVFYSGLKGRLEDSIGGLAFNKYIIFRPGLLLRKNTDRVGERISAGLLIFFNRLGILKKIRPLPTSLLAEKLAKAPKILSAGKHILSLDKIFGF
jgi:uncharacterized protein YbjT (DUF2867 family)